MGIAWMPDAGHWKPWQYFVAALALGAISMALRYLSFSQTPFANGWDSYYYLVQIKSIEETGRMHSPEGSLIYPFLRLFYWIFRDYISAIKWGSAALCGVWTVLMGYWPKSRKMGLLLAAWSVFSPHLTYFAAAYPKNLLGVVLFFTLISVVGHGARNRAFFVFILLILNYFGHRMTFGLSVAYVLLHVLFQQQTRLLRLLSSRKTWLAAVLFVLIIFAAGRVAPGLARLTDLQRLDGTFSAIPQFAPWSFATTFGLEKISGWWFFELVITVLLVGILLVQSIGGKRAGPAVCALLVIYVGLLFPFLTWTYLGLSWRFFLVFVLLAPLLLRDVACHRACVHATPVLLLAALFSWRSYVPALHDPNYALFSRVTQNAEKCFERGIKPELLIAHNALAEYFTFSTGIDAMPWLPEYAIDSTRLWRLATGVRYETLGYYAEGKQRGLISVLGGGYFLLPEYCWQAALKNARAEQDTFFLQMSGSWRNPYQVRPAWLLERHK